MILFALVEPTIVFVRCAFVRARRPLRSFFSLSSALSHVVRSLLLSEAPDHRVLLRQLDAALLTHVSGMRVVLHCAVILLGVEASDVVDCSFGRGRSGVAVLSIILHGVARMLLLTACRRNRRSGEFSHVHLFVLAALSSPQQSLKALLAILAAQTTSRALAVPVAE